MTTEDGGSDRVRLDSGLRGWIRRLAPPRWRTPVTSGSEAWAVRSAWTSLLITIASNPVVSWLTSLDRLFFAENKLLQARAAEQIGIRVPATAVVSSAADIPDRLGSPLVVKPLGPSHFTDEGGDEQVLWSRPLDRSASQLAHLKGAPFILQQHLNADRHLRVVTVCDHVWVCALDAAGLPVDWRRSEEAHGAFEQVDEADVADAARRIAAALGVGYSSQDWIASGKDRYFIELNPAGQWLFLPEPVASEVTGEIAAWLTP
jgi:glutathione synthase/RimK-type ligase-like ATP-grasp enzyme